MTLENALLYSNLGRIFEIRYWPNTNLTELFGFPNSDPNLDKMWIRSNSVDPNSTEFKRIRVTQTELPYQKAWNWRSIWFLPINVCSPPFVGKNLCIYLNQANLYVLGQESMSAVYNHCSFSFVHHHPAVRTPNKDCPYFNLMMGSNNILPSWCVFIHSNFNQTAN